MENTSKCVRKERRQSRRHESHGDLGEGQRRRSNLGSACQRVSVQSQDWRVSIFLTPTSSPPELKQLINQSELCCSTHHPLSGPTLQKLAAAFWAGTPVCRAKVVLASTPLTETCLSSTRLQDESLVRTLRPHKTCSFKIRITATKKII